MPTSFSNYLFLTDPIGLALARRCSAFGLKVVIYDSTVPEGLCSGLGLVQSEHLEKLLPLCHFLSFHSYWIDGSNYQERHFDLTSYKIGLIRKGESGYQLICSGKLNWSTEACTGRTRIRSFQCFRINL